MPKTTRARAYLVSVSRRGEAVCIYAVLAETADEAMEAAAALFPTQAKLVIVGGLSRGLAKRLHLNRGQPQVV